MSALDSESSDSSNEFLVPADQIDLDSTFFKQTAKKSNLKKAAPITQESSDESDDDFDYSSETNLSSAELLSQVLKNLENTKNQSFGTNTTQPEASTSFVGDQNASCSKIDLSNEINDLLMQGESANTLSKEPDNEDENVEDSKETKYTMPEKGVQIHLPRENLMFDRKKKKQQDLQKLLQNKINHRIRSCQVYVHKTGLLCWLAYGFHLNKIINDPDLLGISLSLVSSNNYPKGRPDLNYAEKFTKWFAGKFKISEYHKAVVYTKDLLLQRIVDKIVFNYVELVLLYIATLRGMGIHCRLIISLQPPKMKPTPEQLFKIPKDEEANSESVETDKKQKTSTKDTKKGTATRKSKVAKKKIKCEEESPIKIIPANSSEAQKTASAEAKKKAVAILKGKGVGKKQEIDSKSKVAEEYKDDQDKKPTHRVAKKVEIKKDDSNNEDKEEASNMTIARKLRSRVAKKNTGPEKKDNKSSSNKKETQTKSKGVKQITKRTRTSSSKEFSESDEESDYSTDHEYVEKKPKKRIVKTAAKSNTVASKLTNKPKDKNRKLLSSDDEKDEITNSYNVWAEVYVESEESWISVSVLDQKIHCASELYKKAGRPVLYVVAWNAANSVKDVTRRYCSQWLTDTRKKRVDDKWWKECLFPWQEQNTTMSNAEDEQLLQRELEQPLPKTVGECKGHPLYALTRHLLKFEALYPPDAVPLGYLKTGEAIYSRHCVHTLYSRETWLKRARVVKPAQEAYKIVKSLPKYDKLSGQKIKNLPLELFGKWQTTNYLPPEAKDGKVPRNEYGNVDLFKKCMLPKGTVFIELPGLNRIARKLNIDCAPACTGFSFGCRGAVPVFEGSVVCEEYEDIIREAWAEEQVAARKREQERRDKRIYGNWKKLIKGLLIREKLALKYNFKEEDDDRAGEVDEVEAISTAKKLAAAMKKTKKAATKALTTRGAKRGRQQSGNTKKKIKN